MLRKVYLIISLTIFIFSFGKAEVKLPTVISSNMVLQQKSKVPLWGWANPGELVKISAGWGETAEVKTPESGKWMVKIKTPSAGGPYNISINGKNKIELKNVLIGEVWVCSGQSNMVFPLKNCLKGEQEVPKADYPKIRLFKAKTTAAAEPQNDCEGRWELCSPKTAAGFSAVAYFFGKELYEKLHVPIGLLQTAWGGSSAEAWMSAEALKKNPDFKPILDRFNKLNEEWQKKVQNASQNGQPAPKKPSPWLSPNHSPSYLYNGMLYPFIPFRMRGVIWYQGENNANTDRSYQYRELFPALIKNWRKDWGQGKFPFYYVQIAPFHYQSPEGTALPELREAQMMTLRLKNTGMAVTMDIGNPENIHPKDKEDVGKRLSLWALAKDYNQKGIVYSGPLYQSMKTAGNKIILSFKYTDGGLMAKPGGLKNFMIAGKDRKFTNASAIIQGDKVVVSSPEIQKPVAVRYAWKNADVGSLFNRKGLPASSFRTDDWPCETFNNK